MKKDVLNTWLKEIVSLVFIQTVQAFLLSIIMIVIISVAASPLGNIDDSVSAVGVIAIIALTSISKLEGLVKKIFGFDTGEHSMKGGMASLASGLVAAKLAGRFLNNGAKITTGLKEGFTGGKAEKLAAQKRLARDMAVLNNKKGKGNASSGDVGGAQPSGEFKPSVLDEGASDGDLAAQQSQYVKNMMTAKQNNDVYGYHSNANKALELKRAREAAKFGPQQAANFSANANKVNNSTNAGDESDVDQEKLYKILDKYDDEIGKVKEKRKAGFKKALSGFAETGGGLGGAALGATLGLATGDNLLKYAGMGLGAGDKLGESAVNAGFTIKDTLTQVGTQFDSSKRAEAKQYKELASELSSVMYKKKRDDNNLKQSRELLKKLGKETSEKINAGNL